MMGTLCFCGGNHVEFDWDGCCLLSSLKIVYGPKEMTMAQDENNSRSLQSIAELYRWKTKALTSLLIVSSCLGRLLHLYLEGPEFMRRHQGRSQGLLHRIDGVRSIRSWKRPSRSHD